MQSNLVSYLSKLCKKNHHHRLVCIFQERHSQKTNSKPVLIFQSKAGIFSREWFLHKTKRAVSGSNRAEKCAWFSDSFQGITLRLQAGPNRNPAMNVDDFPLMTFWRSSLTCLTIYSPTYVIKHLHSVYYRSQQVFPVLIQQAPPGLWVVIPGTSCPVPGWILLHPTQMTICMPGLNAI